MDNLLGITLEVVMDNHHLSNKLLRVACAIIYFIAILAINNFNLSSFLFQTPGLWEMEGTKFWEAFWFEFPFMLLRLIPILLFAVGGICYAIWATKAKKLFDENNDN